MHEAPDRAGTMIRRRLVFYTTSLSGGGAERVWAVLASEFARRGHDVTLALDFDASENRGFIAPEVKVEVLGVRHFRSVLALGALIAETDPDLVISAIGGSDIKALAATLPFGRRRVVTSFHGYLANESRLFGFLHFVLARLWTWWSLATVCVSDGLRRNVVERWHAVAARCVRIYNPIAVEGTDPGLTAEALARRDKIVVGVGRLVAVKGFPFLVRAFAAMKDREARLVILGAGPEREAILAEATRLGVADRLELPGYVAAPWEWYGRARCFALSSEVEAFGNVVVEALAHGLPVVATACDGPSEILDDPRLGTLVPQGDVEAFARALDANLADPGDPAPRMARAGEFSVDAAVDRYEALFERVMTGPLR